MDFKQCTAIVLADRSGRGRGGLCAPHRCRRVAVEGHEFCEVHRRQADLQKLYQQILASGWEYRVRIWMEEQVQRQKHGP